MYSAVFVLLFGGFLALLCGIGWLERLTEALRRTGESMDEASRRRVWENRRNLREIQRKYSLWMRLERELSYSGWRSRFPRLGAELFCAVSVMSAGVCFAILLAVGNLRAAGVGAALCLGAEYAVLQIGRLRAMRAVNDNLLKFLDFLGNYSITAGEITGIFHQISRYMEEPLQSALEECYYEAQTTGDTNLALLSLADKIEHPKFKELIRNMEISLRYCADFTALVSGSRRSVREYLRLGEERKGMLREAVINMFLLLALSAFVLLAVDRLISASVWEILLRTLPGKMALGILGVVLLLFLRQICGLHR